MYYCIATIRLQNPDGKHEYCFKTKGANKGEVLNKIINTGVIMFLEELTEKDYNEIHK